MLILFEGPDGAGKTTTCRLVHDILRRRHEASPWGGKLREPAIYEHIPRQDAIGGHRFDARADHAKYASLTYVDFRKFDLLIDRLWVTDKVYGKVFRRDPYDRGYIRPAKDFRYVFVAHLTAGIDALHARRPPQDPAWDFLPQISYEFEAYFAAMPQGEACGHETFRSDHMLPDDLAEAVVTAAMNEEQRLFADDYAIARVR